MSIEQMFAKQNEEEFELLQKQKVPYRNVLRMLNYIADHESETKYQLILAYHYGQITKVRSERDIAKHNSLATFQNMRVYASLHDGKLPENLEELQYWIFSQIHTEEGTENVAHDNGLSEVKDHE